MLPDVQQKINSIQNGIEYALNEAPLDLAPCFIGAEQTQALLLIAHQLGELISLVSAIGTDLTTRED